MTKLITPLCATILLLSALKSQSPEQQQVPFFLSPTEDSVTQEVREARSKTFRAGFSVFESGPAPMTDVTLKPMSELPLDQSDTVIVGEVTQAQPFLTHDRRGLYTECTIKVLKSIKSVFPMTSDSIVVLRRGGAVRLPDGRLVRSIVNGDGGLPVVGRKYLFFLNYWSNADGYLLVKMWLVQEGLIKAVFPDDKGRVSRGESLYDGAYLVSVLASLKAAVSY